ncbi:hypothetical protein EDB81DRAFT_951625 [Dactylonectria macrodidyma]|uniref:Azaphilone pigments biosynthesis cluster protein L N-terminal domain-containing protein n=1 Tax=Dactylonectria macrodidyma TaxID=307937 RepID=A0A9P9IJM0_9HYPO|nr:hypothetical protein EDB81DRAFT_951625 [Dactylonectria macrodidyma]
MEHDRLKLGHQWQCTNLDRESQELWTVILDKDTREGDSGSWVFNATSGEMIGHIVAASTETGSTLIIPAFQVLEDLHERFGGSWRPITNADSILVHTSTAVAQQSSAQQSFPGVLAVGGFALKAIMTLHGNIRSLKSQNKDAPSAQGGTQRPDWGVEFTSGDNCQQSNSRLRSPQESTSTLCDTSRPSVRDWIQQKYLQGDINDFKAMLAAHKATINIALAMQTCNRIAAVSPEVLEDYKEIICDTTTDLNIHLKALQEKIDRIQAGDATAVDDVAIEWQAMMDEKESTQRGLNMCAQLSAQIAKFETASVEHLQFSERPSAREYVKNSRGEARGTIQSLVARLQTHEALISRQLDAIRLNDAFPEPVAEQLVRLQQTRESISQCIQIVSEAGESANERSNVFEDITLADNSNAFSVSTVNELVIARRLNLSDRSRHFGGQVTDDTMQKYCSSCTDRCRA